MYPQTTPLQPRYVVEEVDNDGGDGDEEEEEGIAYESDPHCQGVYKLLKKLSNNYGPHYAEKAVMHVVDQE